MLSGDHRINPATPFSDESIDESVRRMLISFAATAQWRTYSGPATENLKSTLAEWHNQRHVRLCSSGTLAIELALRGLRLDSSSEVLLASYDYPGNFRSIESAGYRVALCDVNPRTWSMPFESIVEHVKLETRAIVVSHLHGHCYPMKRLSDWTTSKGIGLIEDACQAQGAIIDDKPAGAWGDISVTSFGGSKLVSCGRGGAVMTNDDRAAQRMTVYSDRGNDAFAMSEVQACIAFAQWNRLSVDHATRAERASRLAQKIQKLKSVVIPKTITALPAYYKFAIQLSDSLVSSLSRSLDQKANSELDAKMDVNPVAQIRDRCIEKLQEKGINAGAGFAGFARRSMNRCRQPKSFDGCKETVDRTILIHHTHLLSPHDGSDSLQQILEALEAFEVATSKLYSST